MLRGVNGSPGTLSLLLLLLLAADSALTHHVHCTDLG